MSKRPKQEQRPETISEQLRATIKAREMKAYTLGKLAGVDTAVVQRFIDGERDIRLGTADKIAAALGLRLCRDDNDVK